MALRIGMIGTDGHVGMLLDDIPRVPGAVLCACAMGHDGDRLDRLRRYPAFTADTRCYDDYREMLAREHLDLVGVCRPYFLNAEAVVAAVHAGAHVACEKPVATTEADLRAVEEAVGRAGVRLTALLGMRLLPPFRAARKAVVEGRIGQPILATAQKSYKFGRRPDFYRSRDTYGGTIPWVAIHAVDYIRWTTGLEYTRVAALHGNLAHPDYPGCEDQGGLLFGLSNGGTAAVHFDYLRPDGAPTHGDDRLRIAGSDGVLEILDGRLCLLRNDCGPETFPMPEETGFLIDLARELSGEGRHVVGPEEAVQITRICLKAREAADTGKILDLS